MKEKNTIKMKNPWKQIRINLKQVLHQSKSLDLNISCTHTCTHYTYMQTLTNARVLHHMHHQQQHAQNTMHRPNEERINTEHCAGFGCCWCRCCWMWMRVWKSLYNSFIALSYTRLTECLLSSLYLCHLLLLVLLLLAVALHFHCEKKVQRHQSQSRLKCIYMYVRIYFEASVSILYACSS